MKPRIMRASSRPTSKAEAANFVGEGMMLPIASCVQPQDLPCRVLRR